MENLKIGIIQLNTDWENPESNKKKIETILKDNNCAVDLIILPEMFLTGFSCESSQNSNVDDGTSTQRWLITLSNKYNLAIAGSIKIKDNANKLRNRFFFCSGYDSVQYYDKRHLFPLSPESKNFTAGREKKIFNLGTWSICPQICYDLRFPVWARNSQNYDLLINVANWPESRKYAWRSLLIARAIENQAYVIGVNRTGTDQNELTYGGDSCVISPEGDILLDAGKDQNVLEISLSKSELLKNRLAFPFLKDIDSFTIHEQDNL